jgi:hypothetical protein
VILVRVDSRERLCGRIWGRCRRILRMVISTRSETINQEFRRCEYELAVIQVSPLLVKEKLVSHRMTERLCLLRFGRHVERVGTM